MTLKTHQNAAVETLFVLTLGFGLFVYASSAALIQHTSAPLAKAYSNFDFMFIVLYELIALSIIVRYLKYRQWRIQDFNLKFSYEMIGVAVLLVLIRECAGYLLNRGLDLLGFLNPEAMAEPTLSIEAGVLAMVLMLIVNSVYEEVLLIGYIFKRFEHYHPAIIIGFSLLVRASFHTYQGWAHMPMVFMLALVFGVYYTRYKKLWPLILAHGIGNAYKMLLECT